MASETAMRLPVRVQVPCFSLMGGKRRSRSEKKKRAHLGPPDLVQKRTHHCGLFRASGLVAFFLVCFLASVAATNLRSRINQAVGETMTVQSAGAVCGGANSDTTQDMYTFEENGMDSCGENLQCAVATDGFSAPICVPRKRFGGLGDVCGDQLKGEENDGKSLYGGVKEKWKNLCLRTECLPTWSFLGQWKDTFEKPENDLYGYKYQPCHPDLWCKRKPGQKQAHCYELDPLAKSCVSVPKEESAACTWCMKNFKKTNVKWNPNSGACNLLFQTPQCAMNAIKMKECCRQAPDPPSANKNYCHFPMDLAVKAYGPIENGLPEPQAPEVPSCTISVPANGQSGTCPPDAMMEPGSTCLPTCNEEYEPDPIDGKRTCDKDGNLEDTFNCVKKKTCSVPQVDPENGSRGTCPETMDVDSDCTPTCNENFRGTGKRTCSKEGELVDSFKCEAIPPEVKKCTDHALIPENGKAGECAGMDALPAGSVCKPSCDSGYSPKGERRCTDDGKIKDDFECVMDPPKTCTPDKLDPENGKKGEDCEAVMTAGSTCMPSCNKGFIQKGVRKCSLAGEIEGDFECAPIPEPEKISVAIFEEPASSGEDTKLLDLDPQPADKTLVQIRTIAQEILAKPPTTRDVGTFGSLVPRKKEQRKENPVDNEQIQVGTLVTDGSEGPVELLFTKPPFTVTVLMHDEAGTKNVFGKESPPEVPWQPDIANLGDLFDKVDKKMETESDPYLLTSMDGTTVFQREQLGRTLASVGIESGAELKQILLSQKISVECPGRCGSQVVDKDEAAEAGKKAPQLDGAQVSEDTEVKELLPAPQPRVCQEYKQASSTGLTAWLNGRCPQAAIAGVRGRSPNADWFHECLVQGNFLDLEKKTSTLSYIDFKRVVAFVDGFSQGMGEANGLVANDKASTVVAAYDSEFKNFLPGQEKLDVKIPTNIGEADICAFASKLKPNEDEEMDLEMDLDTASSGTAFLELFDGSDDEVKKVQVASEGKVALLSVAVTGIPRSSTMGFTTHVKTEMNLGGGEKVTVSTLFAALEPHVCLPALPNDCEISYHTPEPHTIDGKEATKELEIVQSPTEYNVEIDCRNHAQPETVCAEANKGCPCAFEIFTAAEKEHAQFSGKPFIIESLAKLLGVDPSTLDEAELDNNNQLRMDILVKRAPEKPEDKPEDGRIEKIMGVLPENRIDELRLSGESKGCLHALTLKSKPLKHDQTLQSQGICHLDLLEEAPRTLKIEVTCSHDKKVHTIMMSPGDTIATLRCELGGLADILAPGSAGSEPPVACKQDDPIAAGAGSPLDDTTPLGEADQLTLGTAPSMKSIAVVNGFTGRPIGTIEVPLKDGTEDAKIKSVLPPTFLKETGPDEDALFTGDGRKLKELEDKTLISIEPEFNTISKSVSAKVIMPDKSLEPKQVDVKGITEETTCEYIVNEALKEAQQENHFGDKSSLYITRENLEAKCMASENLLSVLFEPVKAGQQDVPEPLVLELHYNRIIADVDVKFDPCNPTEKMTLEFDRLTGKMEDLVQESMQKLQQVFTETAADEAAKTKECVGTIDYSDYARITITKDDAKLAYRLQVYDVLDPNKAEKSGSLPELIAKELHQEGCKVSVLLEGKKEIIKKAEAPLQKQRYVVRE